MSKTAVITARIEPEIKEEAEKVLSEIGLSMSKAVTLYLRQIVYQQAIPFELRLPTEETLAAIKEARHPETLPSFQSIDELFDDLER